MSTPTAAVVDAQAARLSPTLLAVHASSGRFRIRRHLALIDDVVVRCATEGGVRAIIEMPPRHGKSETISRYSPAWYLGVKPDARVGLVSYEAKFASLWGGRAREVLASCGPEVFGVRPKRDSGGATSWEVEGHEGGMLTTGIGGPLTGRGVDLLIIDDPVKNAEAALSERQRDAMWDWYVSTARTRLEPGGSIIVLQTRWHEDDLAGRLLAGADAEHADQWERLSLPAIAESDNDPVGRSQGEALWPARYPLADLERIKASIGTFWFAALYQQRPAPLEGGLLQADWWRHWTEDPVAHGELWDAIVGSWDCNFKEGKDSDYVVGQVWGRVGQRYYLLDQVRGQWGFVRTLEAVRSLAARWPIVTTWYIESAANGEAIIDSLRHELPGIDGVSPEGSKLARVAAISGLVESGAVYLPDPRREPWVSDLIAEAAVFPNGANDDQVDSLSQALRKLRAGMVTSMRSPF